MFSLSALAPSLSHLDLSAFHPPATGGGIPIPDPIGPHIGSQALQQVALNPQPLPPGPSEGPAAGGVARMADDFCGTAGRFPGLPHGPIGGGHVLDDFCGTGPHPLPHAQIGTRTGGDGFCGTVPHRPIGGGGGGGGDGDGYCGTVPHKVPHGPLTGPITGGRVGDLLGSITPISGGRLADALGSIPPISGGSVADALARLGLRA